MAQNVKQKMHNRLKPDNKQFFSKNRYLITLLLASTLAIVAAQVWWIVSELEPNGVRAIPFDTLDDRYTNALESPTTDNLEARVSSLTGNMAQLSGLITSLESKLITTDKLEERISSLTKNLEILGRLTTDLESKQMATDKLEARISGLTQNMGTLTSLTTDLESRQMAADKLEEQISNITKDLQMLSDLAAGLKSNQMVPLAPRIPFVPVKQEVVSETKPEPPTAAKETPAIETQWASIPTIPTIPTTPDPKPVTDAQTNKREQLRTVPKERRDNDVNKQPAASVPQNGPWTINLISSPDKAYADRFSDTAKSKGIRTELQKIEVKGTPYWRVQVTGFATQGEAKATADTVKDKLGLTDIWIMKR